MCVCVLFMFRDMSGVDSVILRIDAQKAKNKHENKRKKTNKIYINVSFENENGTQKMLSIHEIR